MIVADAVPSISGVISSPRYIEYPDIHEQDESNRPTPSVSKRERVVTDAEVDKKSSYIIRRHTKFTQKSRNLSFQNTTSMGITGSDVLILMCV